MHFDMIILWNVPTISQLLLRFLAQALKLEMTNALQANDSPFDANLEPALPGDHQRSQAASAMTLGATTSLSSPQQQSHGSWSLQWMKHTHTHFAPSPSTAMASDFLALVHL